jgi:hypothetical protein
VGIAAAGFAWGSTAFWCKLQQCEFQQNATAVFSRLIFAAAILKGVCEVVGNDLQAGGLGDLGAERHIPQKQQAL